MLSEGAKLAAENPFRLFGDKSRFALELYLAPSQPRNAAPLDSLGSWGAWRLWIADINLCRLQLDTDTGLCEVQEVRWFLAPLIRWLVESWMPLLHEAHLPEEKAWGDRRPRWARLAYLAMIERAGDDVDRFRPWQAWASRHAMRSAAEGGIVPDVFFQRVGDEIELSWGDRIQPGGEGVTFMVEDGAARAHVDDVANAFAQAIDWFFDQSAIKTSRWASTHAEAWRAIRNDEPGFEPLHWYLDSQVDAGPLSTKLLAGLGALDKDPPRLTGSWLGSLSPEVAMFGDLAPQISQEAATTLLAEYYKARSGAPEPAALAGLSSEEPAWATVSPWENGYALALEVLDEADPDPDAPYTDLETLLGNLSITARDVALGEAGPRGVALAGNGLQPTILVNTDHPMNRGMGHRFTEAHELCHILFDRHQARSLAHSSTPWASPSIEQRANAFAAMLLMPSFRARRPAAGSMTNLARGISKLANRLRVSRVALGQHLSNLGEIDASERDQMLGGRERRQTATR